MNQIHSALDNIAHRGIPENTDLWPQIAACLERKDAVHLNSKTRLAWTVTLAVLVLLAVSSAAYALDNLLGYIPGVGIVEQGTPIRVLAEPVSLTRNGVTVVVTQATITGNKTSLDYRVFGVPHGAYPDGEAVTGCVSGEYLRLPDGTKIDVVDNMPSIPATINTATFVMPCILNTLPGTVPQNWELPLRFVPAPPNLTVLPVTEILPSATSTAVANTPVSLENPLVVTKVLEIGNSYIIMGEFRYNLSKDVTIPIGSWWQGNGRVEVTDATGQSVPYTFPNNIDEPTPSGPDSWITWIYQVQKDFVPPLTFSYQGKVISPIGSKEQAQFEFDAGPNPQSGQQWALNKDFKLGGYSIQLVSVSFDANGGYGFHFKADPGASANLISVEIAGYTPECGGGGGGNGDLSTVEFAVNICVADMAKAPKGNIKATLSFQALTRTDRSFSLQWQPAPSQAASIETSTPQPGVCITHANLSQLAPAPQDLQGQVLINDEQVGILSLSNLNGTQKHVLGQVGEAAFLPDGKHVSYEGQAAFQILDTTSGQIRL